MNNHIMQNTLQTVVNTSFAIVVFLMSLAQISAAPQAPDQAKVWREKLTSAKESPRWSVGARFGAKLSKLPGDQAYNILVSCWHDIADSVRPQILIGFCPAVNRTPERNDRFFDAMHLGYIDTNERVNQFAVSYLSAMTFSQPDKEFADFSIVDRKVADND